MPQRIPPEEFEKIYSKVPRLSVDLLIKTPEGILLTKRSIKPYKNKWHMPGGTILLGESVEKAVIRIGKEEVGLDVGIDKLVEIIEYPDLEKKGGVGYTISLVYKVHVEGGKLKIDKNASEARVFKELPKDLIKKHEKALRDVNFLH